MRLHFHLIFGTLSSILILFFGTWIFPAIISGIEGEWGAFRIFMVLGAGGAFVCFLLKRLWLKKAERRMMEDRDSAMLETFHIRDAFVITSLIWALVSLLGALPLWLYAWGRPDLTLDFPSALFESVSGLTTTGATALPSPESWPKGMLFYRSLLEWLGGMGIIVLTIAVFPALGAGGVQMFTTEVAGPNKDEKVAPHMRDTAKTLWRIYTALTLLSIGAFWASGMDLLNAVNYSFSIISTGGLAPHNDGLAHYHSHWIEFIAFLTLILGSINFGLHHTFAKKRSFKSYFKDSETKFYFLMIAIGTILVLAVMIIFKQRTLGFSSFLESLFALASCMSSTGAINATSSSMPQAAVVILLLWSFIGGASGSTSGGIKCIRILTMFRQINLEVRRLIHPRGFFSEQYHAGAESPTRLLSIWSFLGLYVVVYVVLSTLCMFLGMSSFDAFSAVATTLNNMGVGFGSYATSFGDASSAEKIVLSLSMILGRLEIFTVLVVLTPAFWLAR